MVQTSVSKNRPPFLSLTPSSSFWGNPRIKSGLCSSGEFLAVPPACQSASPHSPWGPPDPFLGAAHGGRRGQNLKEQERVHD